MALKRIANLEFLGFGMLVPFRIDGHGDIANGGGMNNLRSRVRTLLGTRQGEMPWKPNFGLNLDQFRHAPNDRVLEQQASFVVHEQFRLWEPQIEIANIQAARLVKKNRILLTVNWKVTGGVIGGQEAVFSETVVLEA